LHLEFFAINFLIAIKQA